jgi:Leucine-rich repeat (LRR) protein/energy-coupling factor transporter ATP-binding protein EcfA2
VTNDPTARQMPYIGLRPFEEADQRLYYGREEQVSSALTELEDHAFLAVVGASGSGKSSFVRAGIIPAIREGFLLGKLEWQIAVAKPGLRPFESLADALCASAVPEPSKCSPQILLSELRESSQGLTAAHRKCGYSPTANLLVVVDQFEELFAFRRSGPAANGVVPRDEASAFVRTLLRATTDSQASVRVVITIRSDFIGDCEAFLELPERISRSQFLVPRMERTQMERAIFAPSRVSDHGFEPFEFEEGFVNHVINDAGDKPDQLPLLQHALMRTWKVALKESRPPSRTCLTIRDYVETVGGIQDALSRDADAALGELQSDPTLTHIAHEMFLLLCDFSSEGQLTRRRPTFGELQQVLGTSAASIREIVRVFRSDDRNFLVPSAEQLLDGALTIDVCHESLLRRWRTFTTWLAAEVEKSNTFVSLRDRANRWPIQEPLLIDPALTVALSWRDSSRPTPNWAARYGGGLEKLLAYLEESAHWKVAAAAEQERQQREGLLFARQRAEEQAASAARYRRIIQALTVIFCLMIGAIGIAFYAIRARAVLAKTVSTLTVEQAALETRRAALDGDLKRLARERSTLESENAQMNSRFAALTTNEEKIQESNNSMLAVARSNGTVQKTVDGGVVVKFGAFDGSLNAPIQSLPYLGRIDSLGLHHGNVDSGTIRLVSSLRDLQELDLSDTDTRDGDIALISKLPKLRSLLLADTQITTKSLELLAKSRLLRRLDVSRTRVNRAAIATLRNRRASLRVTYIPDLFLEALSAPGSDVKSAFAAIQSPIDDDLKLELVNSPITNASFKQLLDFEEIRLFNCTFISNEGFQSLARSKKLKTLELREMVQINDEVVPYLVAMKSLETLGLHDVHLTTPSISALSKMMSLRDLTLRGTNINVGGAKSGQTLTFGALRSLRLQFVYISADAIDAVLKIDGLHLLSLKGSLALSDITPADISRLRELPSLLTLELSNNAIDDKWIPSLAKITQLKRLYLDATDISEDGLAKLKELMPGTNIEISAHYDDAD